MTKNIKPEGALVHEILAAWGAHPSLRLWRSNCGVGWFAKGQPARKADWGAYPVRFGVPGQADISGILSSGRRIEIECKTETGRASVDQIAFRTMIEKFGGIYLLVRSLDDVDAALTRLGFWR